MVCEVQTWFTWYDSKKNAICLNGCDLIPWYGCIYDELADAVWVQEKNGVRLYVHVDDRCQVAFDDALSMLMEDLEIPYTRLVWVIE